MPVEIPFMDQLVGCFEKAGGNYIDLKLKVLIKTISLCAIMNHPPAVTAAEIGAYIYGTDIQTTGRWLEAKGYKPDPAIEDANNGPIVATKVDYYTAKCLTENLLRSGSIYMTDRKRKVLETVQRVNTEKSLNAMVKKEDIIEKQMMIAKNHTYWVDRETVFKELNKSGTESVSLATVTNELVELVEMGILGRAKPPRSRHFGYFMTSQNTGEVIQLPQPSEIKDPVFEGKSIEVVNPVSGQIEKI